MPIKPEYLVRGLDGKPVPPQGIIDKLRKHDPRLGLFYTKASWAITESWRENDPRREWIQNGSMQPEMAFDICGHLPITCSLEEAPAYIERELKSYSLADFTTLRGAVARWNFAEGEGQDEETYQAVRAGVSDALDKSNDVSPGISAPVGIDLKPKAGSVEALLGSSSEAAA